MRKIMNTSVCKVQFYEFECDLFTWAYLYSDLLLQSRHLAASSQKLRDSLKNKYGGETFDQKVLKAELYNKIANSYLNSGKSNSAISQR